jgi:FAD/FMN-containing dehydrogenase
MTLKIRTRNGNESSLPMAEVGQLAASLRGRLIGADDADYDAARKIWNAMIDRRPALITRCAGAADVLASVRFAARHDIALAVRGGGHNIAGSALCEGGLVIDLSAMRGVRVDAQGRRAWVQTGALLGDIDHETQAFGLAVPTGINSTTGIAGLALGGGFGWLSRAFGHTVDNMLGADLVTADGSMLHVSDSENADLFWAIRGGSGNFGVVTGFEFRLHPVGPMLLTGPVIHPIDQAGAVLRAYREAAAAMPDEATCWFVLRKAPPLPFLAPEHHGKPVLILVMAYAGAIEQGEAALRPLRELGPKLADGVSPHPYAGWQAAFDPLLAPGARNYWKSHDFTTLSDDVIDLMVEAAATLPGDECEIFTAQLGGVAGRVAEDAMAYPHRRTRFTMNIHGRWRSAAEDAAGIGWVRDLYRRAAQHARGSVYVNFVPEPDEQRPIGAFGANEARLRGIKAGVDPTDMFRANVPIAPLAA